VDCGKVEGPDRHRSRPHFRVPTSHKPAEQEESGSCMEVLQRCMANCGIPCEWEGGSQQSLSRPFCNHVKQGIGRAVDQSEAALTEGDLQTWGRCEQAGAKGKMACNGKWHKRKSWFEIPHDVMLILVTGAGTRV
jgi:hypothetical protein